MDFDDFGDSLHSLFYENQYFNNDCLICLCSLATGDSIVVAHCKHWMHSSCFREYNQQKCPVDRKVFFDWEAVIVDWAPEEDDDDDDDVVVRVGAVGVGNVATSCEMCGQLYLTGMIVTSCIDCSKTFCEDCLIPETVPCPHCGAAASELMSYFAMEDAVPVVGTEAEADP